MGSFKKRIDYVLKHNIFISKVFRFAVSALFKFLGVFHPIKKNTVLFTAHNRGYNDSSRAIYEYMLNDKRFSKFTFYWGLDDTSIEIPGNPIKVKADTWNYFKTAFRAQYWITCVNIERSLKFKKRKQVYLNTDHGITIKTCGNDAVGRKDYNFYYINYYCVSGAYERDMYIRCFNLNPKNIICTGLPRNDELYRISKKEIDSIKERLGLSGKKIILYAPTWRDSNDIGKTYSLRPPVTIEKWQENLGTEYIVLLRAHPYTTELLGVEFNDFVRDYSSYKTVNDLIKIADILISDYSAIIFDFAITEKPIFCFAYDYEDYAKNRGIALDLKKEFPGGIVSNEDDLLNRIKNIDYQKECKEVAKFKNKYIEYGGNATEKCVEYVFGKGDSK